MSTETRVSEKLAQKLACDALNAWRVGASVLADHLEEAGRAEEAKWIRRALGAAAEPRDVEYGPSTARIDPENLGRTLMRIASPRFFLKMRAGTLKHAAPPEVEVWLREPRRKAHTFLPDRDAEGNVVDTSVRFEIGEKVVGYSGSRPLSGTGTRQITDGTNVATVKEAARAPRARLSGAAWNGSEMQGPVRHVLHPESVALTVDAKAIAHCVRDPGPAWIARMHEEGRERGAQLRHLEDVRFTAPTDDPIDDG